MNIPFDAFLSRAYWVRLKVSAALSSDTAIAECRVYSVPPALKKHKVVEVQGTGYFWATDPMLQTRWMSRGNLKSTVSSGQIVDPTE